MQYVSTRSNKAPCEVTASDAIIKGLASDGGLFVPTFFPKYSIDFNILKNMNYKELAFDILSLYLTDFSSNELSDCIEMAYGSNFDDDRIAPLKQAGECYFLELFHGKTIAFKDMALSILPHLMTYAIKKHQINKEIVILTATSGDTGKAALSGFANVDGTKVIVFYPHGGVSQIQKLQMVTQEGNNLAVAAIKGNFDDAQRGVKEIFSDVSFSEYMLEKGYMLSSANSINIGRLIPQIIYYYYAYGQMIKNGSITANELVNFAVPTGNFGNILAGYYAKKMGLPINKLICASNTNNVLYDYFNTNVYDTKREFVLTVSPSMDILISSNLERLLYDMCGMNGDIISMAMNSLQTNGKYDLKIDNNVIHAEYASEQETFDSIKEVYKNDYIIDTHTAVAYVAFKKYLKKFENNHKTIIVSTASPYKFSSDVCKAINGTDIDSVSSLYHLEKLSDVKIPLSIKGLETKQILHNTIIDKDHMKDFVKKSLMSL